MLHRRNNVGQQLSTLLDVTCCVRLHTLLHVVAQSLKPVKLLSQQLPTFLCSVIAEAQQCWIPVHSSSNIAHYTWSIWSLQGLMGCILPTMHCRSQHCWELSHHFAHHCQHGRNNCKHCWQHCWPNFARTFNCKIYWTYRKGLLWDHKTTKITLRENLYVECLDC